MTTKPGDTQSAQPVEPANTAPVSPTNEPRNLGQLASAVFSAQSGFLDATPPAHSLQSLLVAIVGVTGSRGGCLVYIRETEAGADLETVRCCEPADVHGAPAIGAAASDELGSSLAPSQESGLQFADLQTLVGGWVGAGDPFVVDRDSTGYFADRARELLAFQDSYAGIPLHSGGRLFGALTLWDRPGGFSPVVLGAIAPALDTITLLLRVMASEEACHQAQVRLRDVTSESTSAAQSSDGSSSNAAGPGAADGSSDASGILQQIVDALPQRVFWKDEAGHYLGTNEAFRKDCGLDPLGLTDYDMPWTTEQADFFRSCDKRIMSTGRSEMDIIEPILTDDGQTRLLSTCKMPLHDRDGHIFGVLGTYLDITAIKENEVELGRARDAAEAATRAKSEFLATMSHEIRTPLNGVLGYLDLVLDSIIDGEQREMVETARSSGVALLHIINDILDFSKLEAGKFVLENVPFEVRSVVADVVELLALNAQSQGVELFLVWEEDTPRTLIGDANRLRQILVNLIGNAVKFSSDSPVTIAAEVSDPGFVRFRVVDSGVGIPYEKQASIFERFTQVDASPARRFGGTGLGLAISKRLVEAMGGEIGVESEPGQGTTFWFRLPITGDWKPDPVPEVDARGIIVTTSLSLGRSLCIEAKALAMEFATVSSIADVNREVVGAGPNALPLTFVAVDAATIQGSGREDLARLRSIVGPNPRCALLTPRRTKKDLVRLREAGWDDFLVKPFLRTQQLATVLGTERSECSGCPDQDVHRPGTAIRRRSLHVLLVEDNAVNRRLAQHILERSNCTVDIAENGREAVESFRSSTFDVIFMDCQMPEMDGFAASEEIRAIEMRRKVLRRTPIVALTANALTGDRERCFLSGMNDYVAKPFVRSDIERVLDRFFQAGEASSGDGPAEPPAEAAS
ncbi:MAG: ATP-binding protein [Candidatus Eisenbacteria bacterium]